MEKKSMKHTPLKIGDLTLEKPLFQGGMGIGVSLSRLAGAVAKAGGGGTISAAQIGFLEPDFDENPRRANLRAMEQELVKARRTAPEGVVGFNIMAAMQGYEEYVRQAVNIGADFIVSGAGLPADLPGLAGTAHTKIAPIVSTEKAAGVILRYWDRKYRRIPDFLVIEGPKAGGHLGFTRDQIEAFEGAAYEKEVEKILAKVQEYEQKFARKIPVVLGGGISDRETAERAFSLGADAVQAASRFVATQECDAADAYKRAYIEAEKEDIILVQSPVGMPGRAIRNPFLERVAGEGRIPPGKCRGCLKHCNPLETPYCITEALIHAAKGEVEEGLLFCGADAWKIRRIETVEAVMEELLG